MTPEQIAQAFHEAYERLAPSFGYETRKASAVPWEDVPEANRALMVAVVSEVVGPMAARLAEAEALIRTEPFDRCPSCGLNSGKAGRFRVYCTNDAWHGRNEARIAFLAGGDQ